jgi:hypothetical protein
LFEEAKKSVKAADKYVNEDIVDAAETIQEMKVNEREEAGSIVGGERRQE